MLVTVPLVLLLLDYWPLGRVVDFATLKKAVLEKLPLLGLSLASSWATILAQKATLSSLEKLSILLRIENALVAYAAYLGQMVWPVQLVPYYQHPGNHLPTWHALVAGLVFVGISALVFASRRKQPYLLVGWLWYVIMMVPVIGLVQVSMQGHADRYTYLPHIGLYVAIAWAAIDWSSSWRYRQEILGAVAFMIIALLGFAACKQTSYWRNGESLWTRALTVDPNNGFAYFGLGEALLGQNRLEEGIARLQMAVVKWPWFSPSYFQLAGALAKVGEREGAIAQYKKVIALGSPTATVHYNLGMLLSEKGEAEEAISEYQEAVKLKPNKPEAETAWANVLLEQGKLAEAVEHYQNVVRRFPQDATAHYNLAVGFHRQGRLNEAIGHYRQTLVIQPNYPDAHYNLGNALLQNGQFDEGRAHLEAAKSLH
jgi:tetratricopeptide (TPR) repeat protein